MNTPLGPNYNYQDGRGHSWGIYNLSSLGRYSVGYFRPQAQEVAKSIPELLKAYVNIKTDSVQLRTFTEKNDLSYILRRDIIAFTGVDIEVVL